MIEVTFTCNVCGLEYKMKGLQKREPRGWGTVRPTLRVNSGDLPEPKKDQDEWFDFRRLTDSLKKKLCEKEYHVCHQCLKTAQSNILQIEAFKKRAQG